MKNAIQNSSNAISSRINENEAAELFQKLVINGDLSGMTQAQQIEYYKLMCERVGLDAYQKPFDILKLSGKLVLYATKTATSQLTARRNLRVTIVAREVVGDQYVVTARCETQQGGSSEDIGAVPIGGLRGDAVSNAMKKAATQAKRRAILTACGLGMLDEEEVTQIQGAEPIKIELGTPIYTAEEESELVDLQALVESATTSEEMSNIVALLKSKPVKVRDAMRDVVAERAKELNIVWKNGEFKRRQDGTKD